MIGVAPCPGGERFLLVGLRLDAGHALVLDRLAGEEALERGAGELAGIPGMIRPNLRITDARLDHRGKDQRRRENNEREPGDAR